MGKSDSKIMKDFQAEIQALPDDYRAEISALPIKEAYKIVEEFKKDFLVLHWLDLYLGSRKDTSSLVVGDLYAAYPGFKEEVEKSKASFPAVDGRLGTKDKALFAKWQQDNSDYNQTVDGKYGAFSWLGACSVEVQNYFLWVNNQRYKPGGFEYVPFREWCEKMSRPPSKILVEVRVSQKDFKTVSKGLASAAQYYSDAGGEVDIVPRNFIGQNAEMYLKADQVAYLLQVSVKTIYSWVSEGEMPCHRKDNKHLRFAWDEVKKWYSQYHQKGRGTRRIKLE